MKPHSWWPFATAMVLVALCWWLATRTHEQGRNGPDVPLGIYPPGETHVPSVADGRLPVTVTVEPSAHPQPMGDDDQRFALEVVPWDEIAIVIEDHHPLSRTLAKALAEHLTGHLAVHEAADVVPAERAARMVIMVPAGEPMKLPLAVRRVLRVTTTAPDPVLFEDVEREVGAAIGFRVAMHDAITPTMRSASGLAPTADIRARAWSAELTVAGSDDPDLTWPQWHATVGRHAAAAILREMLGDDGPPVAWSETLAESPNPALRRHHHALDGIPAWDGTVNLPPRTGVERWHGVVQTPLLRGWSGAIVGTRVPEVKKGIERDTIDVFSEVIESAKWAGPEIDDDTGRYTWRGTDRGDFDRLVADPRPWGWVLAAYEIHPAFPQVVAGWIERASDDPMARAHLRRHFTSPLLGNEAARQAVEVLRADADFADRAAIGSSSWAMAAERQAAAVAAWIRGVSASMPANMPPAPGVIDFASWNRRAVLSGGENAWMVVVPVGADGRATWRRTPGGDPAYRFEAPSVPPSGSIPAE